jgi:hypothetical protein
MSSLLGLFSIVFLLASCGGTHAPAPSKPANESNQPNSNQNTDALNPVEPTLNFASIQAQVLRTNCMECHSVGGRTGGRRIPFDTYEQVMQSDLGLVIPGQPEKSLLVSTTLLNDADRMPPPNWRAAPLDPASIDLLKEWIRRGAPK